MRRYSISEAARKLQVQRATLYDWIAKNLIPTPHPVAVSGVRVCLWSQSQFREIERYKAEHYREKPSLRKHNKRRRQSG
jgi:excisionase family DNA binding protein